MITQLWCSDLKQYSATINPYYCKVHCLKVNIFFMHCSKPDLQSLQLFIFLLKHILNFDFRSSIFAFIEIVFHSQTTERISGLFTRNELNKHIHGNNIHFKKPETIL